MTKAKLCGIRTEEDIQIVNELMPEYIGFIFWDKSWRNITKETATHLKKGLNNGIQAVGVFVDENVERVAEYLNDGIIDIAQLHGEETDAYIKELRSLAPDRMIIKAIKVKNPDDIVNAEKCSADMVLLDSGYGSGKSFDWDLIRNIDREYILAGGLTPENVAEAIERFRPYAVDASSSLETEKRKDRKKMTDFINAVRSI